MSRIPSTFSANTSQQPSNTADAIKDIDLNVFLNLMIKELQNQDPLNPLDNKDMIAQISQIREVGATDKLTETLESVLLGQNIASATNLIGADITALSDDNENVQGIVSRVSLDQGVPKLHIELPTKGEGAPNEGRVDKGTHSYRVVWEDDSGNLFGIDLSGENAVTTTGMRGIDQSILLRNLPVTPGPKQIYRTDATGSGEYRLVGVLNNGSQGAFVDTLSDDERSETRLTRSFQRSSLRQRKYEVSLNNISGIKPPQVSTNPPDDTTPEFERPVFAPNRRTPIAG